MIAIRAPNKKTCKLGGNLVRLQVSDNNNGSHVGFQMLLFI